ncbi:hypothetical protein ABZ297_12675 [Nonomuraea sp. NPDC005983]|uniref:hypothetical protein n=1 Tax=Nonomuraea sp. NPDC005983 TaxID=3155595 RepID=UPI0033BF4112
MEAVGGQDIAEALSIALDRQIDYQPISLSVSREALAGSGLEPYQITHTLSLFSNLMAGYLVTRGTDLTTLLQAEPRPVRDQIAEVVKAGGFWSKSVDSRPLANRS